jgi:hypothetical protein
VKKKESTSVSEAAITPQMLSPFGPLFPGPEAGLLPFMYPGGMPGFYPGMGLPFMQPGLIPGKLTFVVGARSMAEFKRPWLIK